MEETPIQPIQVLYPRPKPLNKFVASRAAWLRPFLVVEWACDWVAFALSRWAFVAVLQYIGTFSILIGVIYYFVEAPDRVKQKHYQAWQVINTAQGKGGAGGRIEALTELNDDGQPLVGVDVSKAFLEGIRLPHASMRRAELSAADLLGADLSWADLSNASLVSANLRRAKLEHCNFRSAELADADLVGADLRHADLSNADLSFADLADVQWDGAKLDGVNIFQVENAPPGFIRAALKAGATSQPPKPDTPPAR